MDRFGDVPGEAMRTACALVQAANDDDQTAIDALVGGALDRRRRRPARSGALVALFNDLRGEVDEHLVTRLIADHRERSFINDEDL